MRYELLIGKGGLMVGFHRASTTDPSELHVGNGRPLYAGAGPGPCILNGLRVGKGRPKVGLSGPRAVYHNELLLGKGYASGRLE